MQEKWFRPTGRIAAASSTLVLLSGSIAAASGLATRDCPDIQTGTRGSDSFAPVYRVVMSPRCRNCHTTEGQGPQIGERGMPHPFLVNNHTQLAGIGMGCNSCHAPRSASHSPQHARPPHSRSVDEWREPGGFKVPGVSKQRFTIPASISAAALCGKMKDVALAWQRANVDVIEFIEHDQLIEQAWQSNTGRTLPCGSHQGFITAFRTWHTKRMPCPQ